MALETVASVPDYAGGVDIVCSAWKHVAGLTIRERYQRTSLNIQDFSTIVYTTKKPIKELKDFSSDLLNITEDEEELGFKHVFQTRVTKATTGTKIRGPMGLFNKSQTYMDNCAQLLLDHLSAFYNN